MFFDTTKAMLKDIRADVQKSGPVQAFAYRVICLLAFASFMFLGFLFTLGLPEPLTWILWFAGVFPVLFFYALWEYNLPSEAHYLSECWPKIWYFRGKQLWPRQK